MEKVPADDEDRPLQDITITGATIFVNPYKELLEEEDKKEEEARKKREKEEQVRAGGQGVALYQGYG